MKPAVVVVLTLALVGCTVPLTEPPVPSVEPTPTPTSTPVVEYPGPVTLAAKAELLAFGLSVPWSIVRLESGSTLISERDTALIKEFTPEGALRVVGTVPGVVPDGEGGLLGLAVLDDKWLYAYITASTDNRILRMSLSGPPGGYSFGPAEVIASGMRKERTHDGGRIKFGPDGMLYATVGDARVKMDAQDVTSLNGKILRMTPEGNVPYDNPFPNSFVYSMGHRNPQGLTWDDDGQLWESELGDGTWDELNRILPGGNYGWPIIEGIGGNPDYLDPVQQWDTDDASPSGLVFTRGTFFLAALRGQRIWTIQVDGTEASSSPAFVGTFGRIRDVIEGPEGTLWFITNNTSNGSPRVGDDRLYEVRLNPVAGG